MLAALVKISHAVEIGRLSTPLLDDLIADSKDELSREIARLSVRSGRIMRMDGSGPRFESAVEYPRSATDACRTVIHTARERALQPPIGAG